MNPNSKYFGPGFFFGSAWLRDEDRLVTGDALFLAVIVHSTGDRAGKEMQDIRRIFEDPNLD